jgi:hypothetical protein
MMLITGKVVNATTNEPVKGARVVIRVGGREVSTHARADAAFEWRDDQSHAGEVVEVTVREEGFVPWQVTQEVQANEAVFEIRLQPVGERTVTGTFLVKDSAGEPVSGAEIGLQGAAGLIASAVSDAQGEASITVSAEVAGRPVGYTVRKDGFVEASGRADLSGTQPVEIVMERAEPATNLLPWLIGGGVGLLAAVLVIAVVVDRADTDGTGGRVEVQPAESVDVVPVPDRDVNMTFTNLGASRLVDRRAADAFASGGIEGVRAVPSGSYCPDARPAILAAGTYNAPVSFLSTARPDDLNACNGVPLELTFASPVRDVTVRFYGAASDYLLVPYDANGRRLGSSTAQGSPYDYSRAFVVTYSSDSANISRVTFGRQASLTMVLSVTGRP